ncbi:helix-turn-helix domain-containing protein [Streptomyces sp. NPDC059593]|uniref:AraC-like ligand-binding domain-containing protein n=1 Tax=Streptomyces sp. NPDC059593 TaxID=3346878 RepID=UPI0036825603
MMSVVLSVLPLPPSERADYWQSIVSDTLVPMDVTLHEREPATGTMTVDTLGPLQISVVEAGPASVTRHAPLISRGGAEYMTITLQHQGTGRLTQDGRQVLVRPGTFTCSDAGRPYGREQPESFRFTSVRVPKEVLAVTDTELRAITGTVFDSHCGTSGVVAGHLERLADQAAGFDPYTGRQLAMTAVDLLTVLVRERQGLLNPHASEVARGMLARIKDYILRHLADPGLSPEMIAGAHHMSVRYLHKIFEAEGTTVSRWIHRERLERCRRELSGQSRSAPTVSAVAQRWGFVNPSHFSRAFRTAYGMSPRDWLSSTRRV